jgi:hypothetical protein
MGETEKMYDHALQGYEKVLGREQVKTYTPALNIMQNLAELYTQLSRANKVKDMYSRALDSLKAVFGRSSKWCQNIVAVLAILRGNRGNSTDV